MARALIGKVALVTGASRSIGAAIARKLADEGAAVGRPRHRRRPRRLSVSGCAA